MKVICIDNKKTPGSGGTDAPELAIGAEYTVIKIIPLPEYRVSVFVLKEMNNRIGYDSQYFSTLDGPDERDMIKDRQHEMAERMDRVWKGIEAAMNQTEPA